MKHAFLSVLFLTGLASLTAMAQDAKPVDFNHPLHYYTIPSDVPTVYKSSDFEGVVDCSDGKMFTAPTSNHDLLYDLRTHRVLKENPLGGGRYNDSPIWWHGYAYAQNMRGEIVVLDSLGNTIREFASASASKPVVYRIVSKRIVDGMVLAEKIYKKDAYKSGYWTEYKRQLVYLNERGEEIFPKMAFNVERINSIIPGQNAFPFCEGLALYQDPNTQKYGYFDRQGNIVIPARFLQAYSFSDGVALVTEEYDSYSGKYTWGYIDRTGQYAIAPKFHECPNPFYCGYAVAEKSNGNYVYIDHSGRPAITHEFSGNHLSDFYDGKALVVLKEEYPYYTYGLIDTQFNILEQFYLEKPIYGGDGFDSGMSNPDHYLFYQGKRLWLRYRCDFITDDGRVWLTTRRGHDLSIVKIMDGEYIYARYDGEFYVFNMEGVALVHLGKDEF